MDDEMKQIRERLQRIRDLHAEHIRLEKTTDALAALLEIVKGQQTQIDHLMRQHNISGRFDLE